MNCPNCGAYCTPDARFCENCGAPIPAPTVNQYGYPDGYGYAPVQAQDEVKAPPRRWPASIGVLLLIAAVFMMAACVVYYFAFSDYLSNPDIVKAIALNIVLPVTLLIAAAVLYFLPTRQKPIVTAIPRMLSMLLTIGSYSLTMLRFTRSTNLANLIQLLLVLAAFVIYLVAMIARPKSPALFIVHLILVLLMATLTALGISGTSPGITAYLVLSLVASLLSGLAYSIAIFAVGKGR